PQQLLEPAGRFHGEGGDGGEEVEELFVARQESQCNVRVTGGGEDNPIFGRRTVERGFLDASRFQSRFSGCIPRPAPNRAVVSRVPAPMTNALASPLLDTPPEQAFDRLTGLAARLLGAPVALVTLLGEDRVFFKSAVGLAEPWASRRSTPLAYSFCRH